MIAVTKFEEVSKKFIEDTKEFFDYMYHKDAGEEFKQEVLKLRRKVITEIEERTNITISRLKYQNLSDEQTETMYNDYCNLLNEVLKMKIRLRFKLLYLKSGIPKEEWKV